MERSTGETGTHLLHSAQESSPRERFIWTSSGGIDFRIDEPLASEQDRMAVVVGEGGVGGEGDVSERLEHCVGDFIPCYDRCPMMAFQLTNESGALPPWFAARVVETAQLITV